MVRVSAGPTLAGAAEVLEAARGGAGLEIEGSIGTAPMVLKGCEESPETTDIHQNKRRDTRQGRRQKMVTPQGRNRNVMRGSSKALWLQCPFTATEAGRGATSDAHTTGFSSGITVLYGIFSIDDCQTKKRSRFRKGSAGGMMVAEHEE